MAKSPLELAKAINPTKEVRYPKGTSKEYSDRINADYEKVIPLLREKGYDVDAFTNDTVDNHFNSNIEGHLRDFFDNYHKDRDEINKGLKTDEINAYWDENYKPTFNALMTALDKYYNDWYIKNAPNGYPKD